MMNNSVCLKYFHTKPKQVSVSPHPTGSFQITAFITSKQYQKEKKNPTPIAKASASCFSIFAVFVFSQADHPRLFSDLDQVFHSAEGRDKQGDRHSGLSCSTARRLSPSTPENRCMFTDAQHYLALAVVLPHIGLYNNYAIPVFQLYSLRCWYVFQMLHRQQSNEQLAAKWLIF